MDLKKLKNLPSFYYGTDNGALLCGDCLEILPHLEPVDLVLTDPPYGIGDKMSGGTWGAAKKYEDFRRWDKKPSSFVFDLLYFKSKNQIVWGANHFENWRPSRCWLVWNKVNSVSTMSDCELAWTSFDQPTKRMSIPVGNHKNGHPTEKPVGLFVWCLTIAEKYGVLSVLDPFLGSGTTAVACERLGRKWVGIEISEEYCEIAAKRIDAENRQLKLF